MAAIQVTLFGAIIIMSTSTIIITYIETYKILMILVKIWVGYTIFRKLIAPSPF